MAEESLVEWLEFLIDESVDESVSIIKRLLALSGSRPIGARLLTPFETWAKAEEILSNDDQIAGYAAQFGWAGLQALLRLRDDSAKNNENWDASVFKPEPADATQQTQQEV